MDAAEAYECCLRDARQHYENFPVASWLLPVAMRPHVAALYAFARTADDFADEGAWSPAERLELLGSWRSRLHACAAGQIPDRPALAGEPVNVEAIFVALGATIRTFLLPIEPFEDLLSAFAQDVQVTQYESWNDLLDYCRRSANPVGRLVLRLGSHADARLDACSDAVCTALQLTNFWQDLTQDLDRGRVYLPRETLAAHGAGADPGHPMSIAWRAAMEEAVARTRVFFELGRPLSSMLAGRLRYEIRATWLGGVRILDRIERADFDVASQRPTLGARDVLWMAPRLLA